MIKWNGSLGNDKTNGNKIENTNNDQLLCMELVSDDNTNCYFDLNVMESLQYAIDFTGIPRPYSNL